MGVEEEGPTSYVLESVPNRSNGLTQCALPAGCEQMCELSACTCVHMYVSACLPGKEGTQLRKLWDKGGYI